MLKIPMLDLDITVVYTIIILWFLLVVLNKIFFKPIGRIINERENKSNTEEAEINRIKGDIESRSAKVESVLKNARKDAVKISEELITKGEILREELIASTRKEIKENFKNRMVDLDREISDAEIKLKGDIKNFSKKIEEIFI